MNFSEFLNFDEYGKALDKLSTKEKQKLMMQWAKIVAQVADGDCP
jgi:hypothetical protein